jgi:hypothetical protein
MKVRRRRGKMASQISVIRTVFYQEARQSAREMKKLRCSTQPGCCRTLQEDFVSPRSFISLLPETYSVDIYDQ